MMKRHNMFFSIVLGVLCSAGVFVSADDSSNKAPENPGEKLSFLELRNGALDPAKAAGIQSYSLIYSITGKNVKDSLLILRAKKPDQIRFDLICGNTLFSVARNGNSFWGYEAQGKAYELIQEDIDALLQSIAFLPIPFYKDQVYADPVFKKREMSGKTDCSLFEVTPVGKKGNTVQVWVENKTKLLHKLEEMDEEYGTLVTVYRNYRDFNGIKLPTTIYYSDVDGLCTMSLVSAEWNQDIPDSIFKQKSKKVDNALALLMDPGKKKLNSLDEIDDSGKNQWKIDQLEKKIRDLKIQIADEEKKLGLMESNYNSAKSSSTQLASVTGGGGARFWNRHGWVRTRGNRHEGRTRSRLIGALVNEADEIRFSYQNTSKKLIKMRIELGDAEAALRKLTKK